MKSSFRLSFLVIVALCISGSLVLCISSSEGMFFALNAPFLDPQSGAIEQSILGTWEANYLGGFERLEIMADGTYRQTYFSDDIQKGENESIRGEWWTETFNDGRVRLYLEGAWYFLNGYEFAKSQGVVPCIAPCSDPIQELHFVFFDPVARQPITMVRELVLNVRELRSGKLILMHMWLSSEQGYAIFGGEREIYYMQGE